MNQKHFHGGNKRRGFSAFLPSLGPSPKSSSSSSSSSFSFSSFGGGGAPAAWATTSTSAALYPYPSYEAAVGASTTIIIPAPAPPAPVAASAAPAAPTRPIDHHAWRYIETALFQRHASGSGANRRAPLGLLVSEIRADTFLQRQYGPAAVARLLAPVASPVGHVAPSASASSMAGGRALVWVGMAEFRRRCEEGGVSPPKRKRPGAGVSERERPRSIIHRLGLRRDDLLSLLRGVSADYRREDAAAAAADEEAAAKDREELEGVHARVEGVLAGFGGEGDSFRLLVDDMEGRLAAREAARKEVALRRAEKEAALQARMRGAGGEELARARLAPLTEEEREEVRRLLYQGRDLDVISNAFNVDMLRQHLRTLEPGTWLNDEVINFWMSLLNVRDQELVAAAAARGEVRRRCWFFNSFFIAKLLKDDPPYCYKNVKRWSRKAGDLFEFDKVFFPVNINNTHWCLAVVHMQARKIQYLDSMSGSGDMYLQGLKRYLADEHKDKKKADLDLSGWELVHSDPGVTPQQGNGSDCGCFASAFAYLISEGIDFKHVSQKDMKAFRERMALSIKKVALSW